MGVPALLMCRPPRGANRPPTSVQNPLDAWSLVLRLLPLQRSCRLHRCRYSSHLPLSPTDSSDTPVLPAQPTKRLGRLVHIDAAGRTATRAVIEWQGGKQKSSLCASSIAQAPKRTAVWCSSNRGAHRHTGNTCYLLLISAQAPKRMGCVVRVNAAGRTATVQWANGGAPTEHSVYQLQVGLVHASRGCPKNNIRNNMEELHPKVEPC